MMLQDLLRERFSFLVHRESRDLSLYVLTVAKGGLKLRPPEDAAQGTESVLIPARGEKPPSVRVSRDKDELPELPPGANIMFVVPVKGGMRLTARGQSLSQLLGMLAKELGRTVVDDTGLDGKYDFNLTWSSEPGEPGVAISQGEDNAYPTLLEAFERQLGLRLSPRKGPVEVLVVDGVNATPTEN